MNLTRRPVVLLAPILLGVLFLTQVLGAQEVWAAWNPAGETAVATYEVIPAEKRVHVTLSYSLKNLDLETRAGNVYYYSWTVGIPLETTNIKAYDTSRPLSFSSETEGSWTYLKLRFNKDLYYGQTYAFTIEYDLAITQNVAVFRAYGKGGGASTVRVVLPRGYYDEVSFTPSGYTTSETDTQTIYTYVVEQEGWRLSALVEAVKKSDAQSLSDTVQLQEREVKITMKFWEGEEAKARNILSLSLAALSALEDVIGVAFPPAYQIVIEWVTRGEIGGYAGANAGQDGILISYTSMDSDDVLIHELAHYWATQPPWKEPWMREGYAELYAYLTLVKLGEESTAEKEIMEYRTSFYEENKDRFQLVLSLWNTPDVLTEENRPLTSFGYNKSFVFVFDLYSRLGTALLQEANQVAYGADQSMDWFDYLHILETSSGDELGLTFVGWVVPPNFGTTFDEWQSAERAYWETEETVAERKGSLGISIVEAELEQDKSLIMNGDFLQALSQIQSTTLIFREWETTEKAFREAEETIAARKGSLGISIVEAELEQAKNLIMNGDFAQALPQIESTTILFGEWQTTEKAFRKAEGAIAERKGSLGISIVEAELEQAKNLIMNGDFPQALSQIQSTTLLFGEWQTTEKAFRDAEGAIAARKGALGISVVEAELAKGKRLIMNGDFAQALSQIESTTILFGEWQTTEKAFRVAEGAIAQAKSEGRTWRLGNTEQIMVQATTLLLEGKLKESQSQSQLAREIADNTTTPLLGITVLLAPYFAGLVGLFGVFIVVRRLRAHARQE